MWRPRRSKESATGDALWTLSVTVGLARGQVNRRQLATAFADCAKHDGCARRACWDQISRIESRPVPGLFLLVG